MSEWQETVFLNLLKEPVRNGIYKKKEFHGRGAKIVNMGELFAYPRLIDIDMKRIELTETEKSKCLLNESDLLFARRSLTAEGAGKCSIVKKISEETTFESSIIRARPNQTKAIPDFLYYYFNSPYGKYLLGTILRQVAVAGITGSDLMELILKVPEVNEQKAISAVLTSLDDKIDLLHRQNKTLEAMAETLFRQWFIEEAQADWDGITLSDICSLITKGTTPTTLGHQFVDTGINFIKAESITDDGSFIFEKFSKISVETHQFMKRSIIKSGDVLCSIAGTIGRVAIVDSAILPANTNQAIAIIRVNNHKCFPEFVYLFLKSSLFQEIMDGKIVHAVQPNLSLGEIGNTLLKLPPSNILHEFGKIVNPIFDKKWHNTIQIHTLEKLRDTLLPKLMNGEVRVAV